MRVISFFLLFLVAGPWSFAQSSNAVSDGLTANGTIWAMVRDGNTLYLGGDFTSIGGQVRNRLAAMDISTGQLTTWDPNADAIVYAMALNGSTLYAGGNFSTVGGQIRNRIAAFNTTDGAVTNWNPNVTGGSVRAIAVGGSTVYIGGDFSNAGGQARNRIAALDATVNTNNAIISWNPGVSELVRALAISGSTLYVGGDFNVRNGPTDEYGQPLDPNFQTIGGATRNYLAALNTSTGTATSWNPDPNDYVFSLAVNGSTIYAGGDFREFDPTGSQVARGGLAAIDATTGVLTAWNPRSNGSVWSLAVSGSAVYVGGTFTSFNTSITRNKLAALNINTGTPTGWNPNAGNFVTSIVVGTSGVYAGGTFDAIGGASRTRFASFPITSVDWGGSSGGSWNQASNWIPGIIPGSTLDVSISSGYPSMDVDFSLPAGKTLTLSGTGSMRVAPGKSLTVAGTADFGGKSVTFQSDATGTARLATVTGTLSNATNVTVERYLPLGRKWRMLTAPLTGSSNNSVFYNWQNNDVVSAGRGVEIWGSNGVADPSSSNDGLALGGGASMRSYGSSGWANVTNTNSTLLFDNTTNYGYALFATGPYNNGTGVGSPSTAAQNTTLSATGTLITGDHTKNFTATSAGQYFLVGNPYASPVDPRSFTATGTVNRTNLNPKLWMWDAKPGAGTGSGLGRYVSFDLSSNTYSVTGNGYADDNVMIQSGQAFFVQAPAIGPATLVFRETSKNANGSHAMMGNEIRTAKSLLRLTLQQPVTTDSTENLDGAVAVFHAEGKAGLDPLDGSKLMNSSENIFFRREARNLTFEHRPMVTAKDTLQLRMNNLQNRTYRLQVKATDFPDTDGVTAELTDRFTGKSMPINLKGVTDHAFAVTADSLSTGDRFMVVFSKSASTGNGTTEPGEALKLNPYPNPVLPGLPVRVDLEAGRAPWDMQLIDATGRLVWKRTVKDATEMQVRIDMSRMGSGVYQLLMTDGKGQRTVSKVVKNQ
jgi:hypothetical protein